MRPFLALLALAASLVGLGCTQKEEAPAPIEGTPAAESKPMTGAPGANGQTYQGSRMPASVRAQMQQKGAPIK